MKHIMNSKNLINVVRELSFAIALATTYALDVVKMKRHGNLIQLPASKNSLV